jgi:hypothetical protein
MRWSNDKYNTHIVGSQGQGCQAQKGRNKERCLHFRRSAGEVAQQGYLNGYKFEIK